MSRETPIDEALARGDRSGAPDPAARALRDARKVDAPVDHNPGTITGETPAAHAARNAMSELWTVWQSIQTAAADSAVGLPDLARLGQRALERGLAACDRATDTITRQCEAMEREITEAVQPPVEPALASDIRRYWRDRLGGKADRLGELHTAVKADTRTSSAVLGAPAYLSGLGEEQAGVVHISAVQAHAPGTAADLEEARRALERVQSASTRATDILAPKIRLWANPEPTSLGKLRVLADGRAET